MKYSHALELFDCPADEKPSAPVTNLVFPKFSTEVLSWIIHKEDCAVDEICKHIFFQALSSLDKIASTEELEIQRLDTLDWIFNGDPKYTFSFDNVCSILHVSMGLEYSAEEMREQLAEKYITQEERNLFYFE